MHAVLIKGRGAFKLICYYYVIIYYFHEKHIHIPLPATVAIRGISLFSIV